MRAEPDAGLNLAREHLSGLHVPLGTKARVRAAVEAATRNRLRRRPLAAGLGLAVLCAGGAMAAMSDRGWQTKPAPATSEVVGAAATASGAPSLNAMRTRPGRREDHLATAALPSPDERSGSAQQAVRDERPRASATLSPAARPSPLAEQVREYRAAGATAGRDDERTVRALRAFRAHWPRSVLDHEAGVELVAALGRLGRASDAREAARDSAARHPEGARAGELRKLAEDGATP